MRERILTTHLVWGNRHYGMGFDVSNLLHDGWLTPIGMTLSLWKSQKWSMAITDQIGHFHLDSIILSILFLIKKVKAKAQQTASLHHSLSSPSTFSSFLSSLLAPPFMELSLLSIQHPDYRIWVLPWWDFFFFVI